MLYGRRFDFRPMLERLKEKKGLPAVCGKIAVRFGGLLLAAFFALSSLAVPARAEITADPGLGGGGGGGGAVTLPAPGAGSGAVAGGIGSSAIAYEIIRSDAELRNVLSFPSATLAWSFSNEGDVSYLSRQFVGLARSRAAIQGGINPAELRFLAIQYQPAYLRAKFVLSNFPLYKPTYKDELYFDTSSMSPSQNLAYCVSTLSLSQYDFLQAGMGIYQQAYSKIPLPIGIRAFEGAMANSSSERRFWSNHNVYVNFGQLGSFVTRSVFNMADGGLVGLARVVAYNLPADNPAGAVINGEPVVVENVAVSGLPFYNTFKEFIESQSGTIFSPLLFVVGKVVDGLDLLHRFVQQFFNMVASSFGALVAAVNSISPPLGKILSKVHEIFSFISLIQTSVSAGFARTEELLGNFLSSGSGFPAAVADGIASMASSLPLDLSAIRSLLVESGVAMANMFSAVRDFPASVGSMLDTAFSNVANSYQYVSAALSSLPDTFVKGMEGVFTKLFVPTFDPIPPVMDEFNRIFPNFPKEAMDSLYSALMAMPSRVPAITVPLSQSSTLRGYGVEDYTVTFDWFVPFRPYVHAGISAFLLGDFAVRQFFGLKSLINAGAGGAAVLGQVGKPPEADGV